MIKLTNSEQEVMELLWESEEALSSREIIQRSKNKTWKDSYIHILIHSLLEKKMIHVSGFKQTTKNYTRVFSPSISREKWMAVQITGTEDPSKMIIYLFDQILHQIHDMETLDQLSEFLENEKKRIEAEKETPQTD